MSLNEKCSESDNYQQQNYKTASQNSCAVLAEMGPQIQWVQSYVTSDKIYCIYIAQNEYLLRQHAQQTGLPANKITAVATMIDPITAEE